MIYGIIILGITLSIDSLFVGFAYGLKGTKIPFMPKMVICIFSVIYSALSISAGNLISHFLPQGIANLIGAVILAAIGLIIIVKAIKNKAPQKSQNSDEYIESEQKTVISLFIKSLGVTIQILKNPSVGDFDNSGIIDIKEAFFIGLALSIDAIGVGIGSSLLGFGTWYFPFIVGLFQLSFLSAGLFSGKLFNAKIKINERYLTAFSGLLLIIFSFIRLIL